MKLLLFFFSSCVLLLTTANCFIKAATIDIGITNNFKVTTLIITPQNGDYDIVAYGNQLIKLKSHDLVQLTIEDSLVRIRNLDRELGSYRNLDFIANGGNCSFLVKFLDIKANYPLDDAQAVDISYNKQNIYDDNLSVSVNNNILKIINKIDLDKYVAGVVKSEVGIKQTIELYKIHSIICRTYALSHTRRHEEEGFELCDNVHCQVYEGKCCNDYSMSTLYKSGQDDQDKIVTSSPSDQQGSTANILKAALSTSGIVIVDANMELITASYHSNCGGQTVNSEDVWSLPKPYLKSVRDTFCLNQRNAQWEAKIPTDTWIQYLSRKYNYPIEDGTCYNYAISYTQEERETWFNDNPEIHLKDLRSDWKLKSTYFTIVPKRKSLTFKGRGYGHGVGLCQEGAMRMAEIGYSYENILHFYYTDVYLVSINAIRTLLK
ncbi:MAG: SpoIID/LytB domain-containing protein [Bacteroidota bacterium]